MKKQLFALGGGMAVIAAIIVFTASPAAFAENDTQDQENNRSKNERTEMKEMRSKGLTLEMNIGDNGKALVRGAKVTSVSGATVQATVAFGSASINFAILTDEDTHFARRAGDKSALGEFNVGDTISFQGKFDTSISSPLTVRATVLKNWSKVSTARTIIQGKVESLSPLILTSGEVEYTIQATSTASVLNLLWLKIPLGDIKVGDTVRVYGQVNTNATIDATVIRDVSVR